MAAKKPYTKESVQRALSHHELTRAIHLSSPPSEGSGAKWRVLLTALDEPLELTLHEAYVLCLGLARGESHWRKASASERPEQHTGWPTELSVNH